MTNLSHSEQDELTEYTGGMTISHLWERNALQYPDKDAIEDLRVTFTWAGAELWIDRVALGLLELGIKRDEVLVVQLPNCVEVHLLRVVCEKAGIRCLPLNSNMRKTEVENILINTRAVGVVIPWEYRGVNYIDMIKEICPNLPDFKYIFISDDKVPGGLISIREMAEQPLEKKYPADCFETRRYKGGEISLIGPTSGSTSLPRLLMYSPLSYSGLGKFFMEGYSLSPNDTLGAMSPAARGPNNPLYFGAPWAAAKIFMLPWTGPGDALKVIEERKITCVCLVPAQLAMMLEQVQARNYDLSSVRIWESTGAPLPTPLRKETESKMGGTVVNTYGLTETGNLSSVVPEDAYEVRMNTDGKPLFGVQIRIVDDEGKEVDRGMTGEVRAKSLFYSLGFYHDEKATGEFWDEEGWITTGDIGMIDEGGNLTIVGRKKDVIIRGGQNIYPAEIEKMLIDHPKVMDIVVVAMPDPVMGEKACAYVVTMGGQEFTFNEMIAFLKQQNIASFKLPERLEILDKFPTLAGGNKVDKNLLRQDIARKLEQEGTGRSAVG
ncbi:MAG: class I adenylate-forming enzyme family protein [Dehalococcoidales bacterium]|nr:class I adenylate-forming enzyme family protein [Dehalococcoidales bacterium]